MNTTAQTTVHTPAITYAVSEWENYANLFASVTTSVQLAVYREACQYLHGDVVDCGCGTAKLAPLLADNADITSYTGIDYAEEMVNVAQNIIQRLQRDDFAILHSKIEDVHAQFTAGVSIQSYYAWPNPIATLSSIYALLAPQSVFILATPNTDLPIEQLLMDAEKELIAHPDFAAYKRYNLQLAMNPQANFISMDALIKQVQQVGFHVIECHQRHFRGGLNFLVLSKD